MTTPDVRQLHEQSLPQSAFPGGGRQPFRVFFAPDIHARIWQHTSEDKTVEICGVLVGKLGKDGDGPFVVITEVIRGEAATSKFAEVTFTHETWAKINHEMDTKFTNLAIVGWYHSHPSFGVFLSDRDLFIQQHFFSGPGQIAHVVDPVRKTEGVFIWQRGKPTLAPFYWVGDRPIATQADTESDSGKAPAVESTAGAAKLASAQSLLDRVTPWLGFFALFLVGYLLGSRVSEADRDRARLDAVAHAALFLGIKPGMREGLVRAEADLDAVAKDVEGLANATKPATEEANEKVLAKWKTTREELAKARQQLRDVRASYTLTAEETQNLVHRTATVLAGMMPGISSQERARLSQQLELYLLQDIKEGRLRIPQPEGKTAAPAAGTEPPAPSTPKAEKTSETAPGKSP